MFQGKISDVRGLSLPQCKTVDCATRMEFLGVILDSHRMELLISLEKKRELLVDFQTLSTHQTCTKQPPSADWQIKVINYNFMLTQPSILALGMVDGSTAK